MAEGKVIFDKATSTQ